MLSRSEAKLLRGLAQRKIREAEGRFLAEGVRVVEALLASRLRLSLAACSSSLEDSERGRTLRVELERRGVPVRTLGERELAGFADTPSPQGVLAVAEIPRYGWSDLAAAAEPGAVLLILDAVQDPGNFGTLVRTAEALGAAGVITLPGTVDPWNPKSVRAAAGASFQLPILAATWEDAAPRLREHGFSILAAAAEGEPLDAWRVARAALVVGNEGAGITEATRRHADALVAVPIRGRAESLNVAAAAAILLHQLLQRTDS